MQPKKCFLVGGGWQKKYLSLPCMENSIVHIQPSLGTCSLTLAFSSPAVAATDFGPGYSLPSDAVSVTVIDPDSFHQLSQSTLVFRADVCEGSGGARLPVDQTS